jgi:hypothetical protein
LIKIKQFQNRNLIAHDAAFVLKTTKTAANSSGVVLGRIERETAAKERWRAAPER